MSDPEAASSSEEEILRKQLKPNPTVEQVIDAVRIHFYSGSQSVDLQLIKELDSYDDRNLWITVDGTNYLAKVHNGVESRDLIQYLQDNNGIGASNDKEEYRKSAIHLQHSIMTHLNESGISTNHPQMTSAAIPMPYAVVSLPVHSKEDSPTPLVLRLLGWVPGRPMSSCKMIPIESLADAGMFLGKLGIAFQSLPNADTLEAAKRYHQWDGKNTVDVKDFVRYITDDTRQSIVESVIDAFQTKILDGQQKTAPFEKSLIHADFNDANFLLDDNYCVSGVIDFGDSVESWTILDLSIAMAYAMLNAYGKHGRMLSAASAMLRGYHSVRPLPEHERAHLPLLIACRLSCSATLGAYSYAQNPGNEYLLLHAKPAWTALELIWGTDPVRRASIQHNTRELFDRACSKCDVDEKTGVVDCSDLTFPDPSIPDPLAGSRSSGTK